jgi:uncharacterized DUF497 family protein
MLEFEWDEHKAASNLQKHGIEFADVVSAVEDDLALTIPDDFLGEGRFVSIGTDLLGRTLVVVYAWRGERVRIVSARRATRRERRTYEGKQ